MDVKFWKEISPGLWFVKNHTGLASHLSLSLTFTHTPTVAVTHALYLSFFITLSLFFNLSYHSAKLLCVATKLLICSFQTTHPQKSRQERTPTGDSGTAFSFQPCSNNRLETYEWQYSSVDLFNNGRGGGVAQRIAYLLITLRPRFNSQHLQEISYKIIILYVAGFYQQQCVLLRESGQCHSLKIDETHPVNPSI